MLDPKQFIGQVIVPVQDTTEHKSYPIHAYVFKDTISPQFSFPIQQVIA